MREMFAALQSSVGRLLTICVVTIAVPGFGAPASLDPAVAQWLVAQEKIKTWSADFVQTRNLKSLKEPLRAEGHVWFSAPAQFRWELGTPAQTIAVRTGSGLEVIYPKLKRVERYPLTGQSAGPWKDALALLEAGFPRDEAQLKAQYNTIGQTLSNGVCELALQPRSTGARKMMPRLNISFDLVQMTLLATELFFADGSSLRNDFKKPILNPVLEKNLFEPSLPSDYKIIEPLNQRRQ
jgi:outer membrane lipoprotein-sorting protein